MTEPHTDIQIVVGYRDGSTCYYKVPPLQGWRFDSTHRQLIIGKGTPRVHIPLDNVLSFEPTPYECKDPSCPTSLRIAFEEQWRTGSKYTLVQLPHSTGASRSAPTSGSSGESMSLPIESATVLTTTYGYRAALTHLGLEDSTQWSSLSPLERFNMLGYLTTWGHVISVGRGPVIHNHPAHDPSCPQCTQNQP